MNPHQLATMRRLLDEMEQHIQADVTLQEWASWLGYSPWHLSRMFREAVGMPVMRYRTRRRLMHAVYQISQGMAVTQAALEYGFDTHAGFYKAFHREYGCSPSQYIRQNRVLAPGTPTLKEEHALMITDAQWALALSHWGMDLPLSPVIFPGSGRIHESCKKAGNAYYLKAFPEYAPCRIQADLGLALHDCNVLAGLPVADHQGQYIHEDQGVYYLLCKAVPGSILDGRKMLSGQAGDTLLGKTIGSTLHQLHLALDNMGDCPIVYDENMLSTLQLWAIPCLRKMAIVEEEWLQLYEDRIALLFPQLPMGPIHRDPNPGSLIQTAAGIIGFLDFDLSERNIRLFDPCYAATAILSECFEKKEWWYSFFQSVLAGYDAVSPLSAAEWAAAPLIALGIEIICIAAFADADQYYDILQTNIDMLRWLMSLPEFSLT